MITDIIFNENLTILEIIIKIVIFKIKLNKKIKYIIFSF